MSDLVACEDISGDEELSRDEMKVNPINVNYFTWLTSANFRNEDLFPLYISSVHNVCYGHSFYF